MDHFKSADSFSYKTKKYEQKKAWVEIEKKHKLRTYLV